MKSPSEFWKLWKANSTSFKEEASHIFFDHTVPHYKIERRVTCSRKFIFARLQFFKSPKITLILGYFVEIFNNC